MSTVLPPASFMAHFAAARVIAAPGVPTRHVPGQMHVASPSGWKPADAFRPTVRARGGR